MPWPVRWLINAVALSLVAWIVPGVKVAGVFEALVAAGLIGFLNAFLKPALLLLTLPFTILTLGLFTLVINGLMLLLASALLAPGFVVAGFWPALWGGLLLTIISALIGVFISPSPGQGRTRVFFYTGRFEAGPKGPEDDRPASRPRLKSDKTIDLDKDGQGKWS